MLYQINVLHSTTNSTYSIFLLSTENLTFLLKPGHSTIRTPQTIFGPTCGLLPVGQPATVTTSGLEWNLTEQETKFGGLVSTSNHLKSDVVEVHTTAPLVFTLEIRKG
jgi:thiamine pyrophosphokinase